MKRRRAALENETQSLQPKFDRQAVVDYYYGTDGSGGKRKDLADLIMKVKQHLLAEGWCFTYTTRHCGKDEPRYSAGIGQRKYLSLRTACKAYLDMQPQCEELSGRVSRIKVKMQGIENVGEGCVDSYALKQGEKSEKRVFWIDLFEDCDPNEVVVTNLKNSSFDETGSFDVRREDCKLDEGGKRRRLGGKNMNDLIRIRDEKRKINGRGRLRRVNNQVKSVENQLKDVDNEVMTQNLEEHGNDDVCSICREGGDLMLCDQCPSAFHASCHGFSEIPAGKFWYCQSCCCGICGQNICGDDSHMQDKQCDQCEQRYHGNCIGDYNVAELERDWFCSKKCKAISFGLNSLLGKPIVVGENNLTWTLLKKNNNVNDPWTNKKLKGALSIMHECFKSVKEPWGGRDVGEDVIFSRKSDLKQLDFRGFYTVILQKGDRVAAFATLRVFGEKVAELPFIATRFKYRRQGMCKTLMNVLEQKLINLGVQKLVLPSMLSVLDTWTSSSFAFTQMTTSDRSMLMGHNFLEFSGTVACQKLLQGSYNR